MNKLFPSMQSKPEKIQIFALIPCWIWVFILFPMFLPFVGLGIWEQHEISTWLEIVYHVANCLLLLTVISGYLKEDWFMVTTDVRFYLKHIALTVGLIVGVEVVLLGVLSLCGVDVGIMLEYLPVAEMSVSHTPLYLLDLQPVFGIIVLSLFTPVSACALFYCLGFAPVCYKKPWLAYLCVAILTLIPAVIDLLWRREAALEMNGYFVRLPIHLLTCWVYQKTDNVWTPIVSLAVTNLLLSIVLPMPIPFLLLG